MFTEARLKEGTRETSLRVARLKDQYEGYRDTLTVHKFDYGPAPKIRLERTQFTTSNQRANSYQRVNLIAKLPASAWRGFMKQDFGTHVTMR